MTSPPEAAELPRPRWERPAYWALLALTALLFLWGLGASGYANSFYSAAAQAGSQSWKAFLFGSLDSSNAITVDKPAGAMWPMALSVRLFGLGGWQILVPQALMGVGAVAVLYASVRRVFGAAAGLLAGALLALTPVAALMFRFNNPDALLCLLMVSAVYCAQRALERREGTVRWLVLCGCCFGAGFLAKTLQAWLILPVVALVYLVCGPGATLLRRFGALLAGGAAVVVSCGWWVALVELWPAASRPYIGGSQHNDFLELTFGYNGFGRITGNETGSVGGHARGGPGGGGGMWGQTGLDRLFTPEFGGQIAWLLPAALILLVAGLVVTRKGVRTDRVRAAYLLWGGSLLITFLIFSFMSGIFHQYYNIALAPYIAAVVAMGAVQLWRARAHAAAQAVLAVTVLGTAVWAYVLLDRSPSWLPWLRWTVLVVGVLAGLGFAAAKWLPQRALRGAVALGLVAALAGPVAYTLDTVQTPKTGSIVTAGPQVQGGMRFPGGGPGGKGAKGRFAQFAKRMQQLRRAQGGKAAGRRGGMPGGMGMGFPGGGARGRHGGGGGGGMGGLLDGQKVSAEVKKFIAEDASHYRWMAAATGSQSAASYQLATNRPVMAIGGFNGSDPYPTVAGFKKLVREKKIHYFIASGGRGGFGGGAGPWAELAQKMGMGRMGKAGKNAQAKGKGGGMGGMQLGRGMNARGTAGDISTWVTKHYTKVTVGGVTLYDLTSPKK